MGVCNNCWLWQSLNCWLWQSLEREHRQLRAVIVEHRELLRQFFSSQCCKQSQCCGCAVKWGEDIPSQLHKASAAGFFRHGAVVHTSLVLDIPSKWHKASAAAAGLSGGRVARS